MKRQFVVVALAAAMLPSLALAQIPEGKGRRGARFQMLSGEERARLQTAHQAALRDPNVAQSRERFQQARREFRDKLRDALLRADPSVQPILEKIRRERRNGGND